MKHVVYIDDEKELLDIFKIFLMDLEDITLSCFSSHAQGHSFVENNDIYAIFLDWRMSDGNAHDFVDRAGDALQGSKIFIITGELEIEDDARITQIIHKPFAEETLIACLQE